MDANVHLPHRLRFLISFTVLLALSALHSVAYAEEDILPEQTATDTLSLDNVEISLVTCEPYDRVYSLYGHTGLRIHDQSTGLDVLANWGIFEMKKRFFVLRFMFGLTDYKMEIEPWEGFCERYLSYGSGVQEQVLNLNADEKQRLIAAVRENYKPENRYYRYNYFYDNCTTRVRDIIEESVDGKIVYPETDAPKSYRDLIHEWNGDHLWARWGNDFLLGVKADHKTTSKEAHFLPYRLFRDFGAAHIVSKGVAGRTLVKTTRWAVPSMHVSDGGTFVDNWLLRPLSVAVALVLVLLAVIGVERKRKKRLWQFDACVLVVTGIMGLVLLAMVFSQHPTVSLNFQILVFNPLSLLFVVPITKSLRQGKPSPYLAVLVWMVAIGILLGVFFQFYAEGVMLLAIFLLEAYTRKTGLQKYEKKKEQPSI